MGQTGSVLCFLSNSQDITTPNGIRKYDPIAGSLNPLYNASVMRGSKFNITADFVQGSSNGRPRFYQVWLKLKGGQETQLNFGTSTTTTSFTYQGYKFSVDYINGIVRIIVEITANVPLGLIITRLDIFFN
jgi:hypothetical protein